VSDAELADRLARARLDWIVPRWAAPPNVRALVTTRNGGTSAAPYATMNVGGRYDGAIASNRRRLREFLPSDPVWLSQVHGAAVALLDGAPRASPIVADACVTHVAEVVCAVRVADCLPVLLADRAGGAVGIAHAGWRGLAAGVVEATITQMRPRGEIVAWLGPAIGPRAFEVGADVVEAFCNADPGAVAAFAPLREAKWLADLCALARRRLARAGVREIAGGDHCTHTDRERFFSYRRDGETGRMAALIWLARTPSV
jgi:YfiH family protein